MMWEYSLDLRHNVKWRLCDRKRIQLCTSCSGLRTIILKFYRREKRITRNEKPPVKVLTLVCMHQSKQISPTSASHETRHTQRVLLVKQSESDKLHSKSLNHKPEVLDIGLEFSSIVRSQEWDVLGGSPHPENPTEVETGTNQTARGSGGRKITQESAAKTNTILGLETDNYNRDDDQPGPSTTVGSKLQGKVNRATTRSKRRDVETRGTGVQMHTISSSERLAIDETDTSSISSVEIQRRSRQLLVGWDTFRSRTMLLLIGLLVVWAIIYFPLILA